MKIGTDAVLLGSWVSLDAYPDTILDIGTGTGVIALMLAQRSDAMTIDAVELEEEAYEEAVENFEQSDWADRLFCYHANFTEFSEELAEEEESYDLIVSNPPFYTADYETDNSARNQARFTSALSFDQLLKGAAQLLSADGIFSVVIPAAEEAQFTQLALIYQLHLNKVCRVKGNYTSEVKRSLMSFSFTATELVEQELVIEKERHNYTEDYIELTKDFYLKM
ncbi:tRNA1(Val) (adenine(37)-N6)-methyltransferase [Polaribacter pacificus]|uniref:tRNA1(Val) (adenine(37)-N6)-methyltransferase n=2 Tax=Polaribacter pacificus TaxID=1775173 RepID=A0A917HXN7_9FLAO|nr:tRNA1(Val) (adenine(37)-N6)-methyltransferase [Polaribacter pacificus]